MRILTLNIWNYNPPWPERRDAIVKLITNSAADVVALQETRRDFRFERGKSQGVQIAERVSYHPTYAVAQVYLPFLRVDEGLTLLTREAPRATAICALSLLGFRRRDENHRICLAATVAGQSRPVHVFNTHFSLDHEARESSAREVADFVRRIAGEDPAVLVGDLNAEADSPEIRFLTEEAGFLDVWRAANGSLPGSTYLGPPQRIDYVLARQLPPGELRAWVIGEQTVSGSPMSDHFGVLAELPV